MSLKTRRVNDDYYYYAVERVKNVVSSPFSSIIHMVSTAKILLLVIKIMEKSKKDSKRSYGFFNTFLTGENEWRAYIVNRWLIVQNLLRNF